MCLVTPTLGSGDARKRQDEPEDARTRHDAIVRHQDTTPGHLRRRQEMPGDASTRQVTAGYARTCQ